MLHTVPNPSSTVLAALAALILSAPMRRLARSQDDRLSLRSGRVDAAPIGRHVLSNCEAASFGNDGLVGHARDTNLDFCFGHSDSFQDSCWSRHIYDSLLVDQAMRV